MTYRSIKTIKGRRYIYEQTSVRLGRKVKTYMKYIGPADVPTPPPTLADRIGRMLSAGDAKDNGALTEEEMIRKGWITQPSTPEPEPEKPITIDGDSAHLTNPAGESPDTQEGEAE